jgi:hypothetical protein
MKANFVLVSILLATTAPAAQAANGSDWIFPKFSTGPYTVMEEAGSEDRTASVTQPDFLLRLGNPSYLAQNTGKRAYVGLSNEVIQPAAWLR